jgi:hypothetical protein
MFSTTANVKHVTPIPKGVPASKGISLLQGHEFFIKCDPHMISYEAITSDTSSPVTPIPTDRGVTAVAEPKCYSVTDKVHALPAGLWDSDVVSRYEFINIERGVFVRIRSPLSVVMESVWEIREKSGPEDLELVEDIVISCSRLLMGTVKGTCESGWQGIHEKMVAYLEGKE